MNRLSRGRRRAPSTVPGQVMAAVGLAFSALAASAFFVVGVAVGEPAVIAAVPAVPVAAGVAALAVVASPLWEVTV